MTPINDMLYEILLRNAIVEQLSAQVAQVYFILWTLLTGPTHCRNSVVTTVTTTQQRIRGNTDRHHPVQSDRIRSRNRTTGKASTTPLIRCILNYNSFSPVIISCQHKQSTFSVSEQASLNKKLQIHGQSSGSSESKHWNRNLIELGRMEIEQVRSKIDPVAGNCSICCVMVILG